MEYRYETPGFTPVENSMTVYMNGEDIGYASMKHRN